MRRFSRWMPPPNADNAWEPKAKIAVAVLVAGGVSIAFWPAARLVTAIFIASLVTAWWLSDRRMRRVAFDSTTLH